VKNTRKKLILSKVYSSTIKILRYQKKGLFTKYKGILIKGEDKFYPAEKKN
jgi:hypothetical protein